MPKTERVDSNGEEGLPLSGTFGPKLGDLVAVSLVYRVVPSHGTLGDCSLLKRVGHYYIQAGPLPLTPLWDEDVGGSDPTVPRDEMHRLLEGGKNRHLGCIVDGVAQVVVAGDPLSTERAVETVDAPDVHLGVAPPRRAGPCLAVDRNPQPSPNGENKLLGIEVKTEGFARDGS